MTVFIGRRDNSTSTAQRAHDDLGPNLNIAVWILTAAALIFLGLRLYCKMAIRKGLWWDDYVLIAASGALVTQTALLSVDVHNGFGKHSYDIHNWPNYLYWANITGVCSIVAAAWSKTSFAITLLRFTDNWKRRFIWFVIITVNLFLGLSALFTYVQCWPFRRLWDNSVPGHCWNIKVVITYNTFSSSWSGVMDIALATLPWTIIKRMSLNKTERLGVLVAMSMGVFAGLTSIAKATTLSSINAPDANASISLMILATAEIAITIMAASIPSLRLLVKSTMKVHHPTPHLYRYFRSEGESTLPNPSDSGHRERPSSILQHALKDSSLSDGSNMSDSISSPTRATKETSHVAMMTSY